MGFILFCTQIIGLIIGIAVLYILIIALTPIIPETKQRLKKVKQPHKFRGMESFLARRDVCFNVNGTTLRGWLYLPKDRSSKVPCIIMANGLGGTINMGLHFYAIRYQEAGFAVFIFDYRYFGVSDGEPRQLIWIPHQLEDYSGAIKYVQGLKEIDPTKIALWGTSFSGGHVITIASRDQNIACVCAQNPGLDGQAAVKLARKREGFNIPLYMHAQRDIFRSWLGLSPHKIPIVGRPGSVALITTPDAYNIFGKIAPANFINEACARIALYWEKYRPIEEAKNVRCPTLIQMCDKDSLLPKIMDKKIEKEFNGFTEVKHYPIGHFDIYIGRNFEKCINDQLIFLKKHL